MSLTEEQKAACRGAAEYINSHGFHQGGFFNFHDLPYISHDELVVSDALNPPACAMGAIAKVTRTNVNKVQLEYQELFKDELRAAGYSRGFLQSFNDHPGVCKEDVVAFLERHGNS